MVCVAAFIILCILSVFVAILSIFRRDIGAKYWKTFKKAWGCVWKKVRLQKCETNFKDEVKNSILKKVVLKRPKLVKPLSTAIEVGAVLIVVITIWSLVEATKAGLSIWTLGTCNVASPASCALGAEACSTEEQLLNWFEEWGEIFGAIPDRLQKWQAADYLVEPAVYVGEVVEGRETALDIVDPGCVACIGSYNNQLNSGFFDRYNTAILIYPIQLEDGSYKFNNSDVFAHYFYATALQNTEAASKLVEKLFTGKTENGVIYQSHLGMLDQTGAEQLLQGWLAEFGLNDEQTAKIAAATNSTEVEDVLTEVEKVVNERVHVKGIPTLIFGGKKHYGLYKS